MATLRVMGFDLANRLVHLDRCECVIATMFDIDGEETESPELAFQVVAKVPEEFQCAGGQWLLLDLEDVASDAVH